jgi:hypothetical protein
MRIIVHRALLVPVPSAIAWPAIERGMRATGAWLILASVGFWLSWWLMPGVGVTDTATIFALVSQQRAGVYASVVVQLIYAAACVVAAAQLRASDRARASRTMRVGCSLLAVGAVGSAADAMFHLVAFEMTARGMDLPAMVPVMQRLQGPDLGLLAPFIAAFLAGHVLLALAWRNQDRLARGALVADRELACGSRARGTRAAR